MQLECATRRTAAQAIFLVVIGRFEPPDDTAVQKVNVNLAEMLAAEGLVPDALALHKLPISALSLNCTYFNLQFQYHGVLLLMSLQRRLRRDPFGEFHKCC